jgi:hypothetical protein
MGAYMFVNIMLFFILFTTSAQASKFTDKVCYILLKKGTYTDDWSWATSSSLYSQLTGVLAGFAFTAIILLISSFPSKQNLFKDQKTDNIIIPTYSLLIVFIGLIIASFLFAMLTGYTINCNTLQILDVNGTIASFIFAICIMQMFMSIVLLFKTYTFNNDIIPMSKSVFKGVSYIALFYIFSTIIESKVIQISNYILLFTPMVSILIVIIIGKYVIKSKRVSSFLKCNFAKCISWIFVVFMILGVLFEINSFFELIYNIWEYLLFSHLLLIIQCLIYLIFDFYVSEEILMTEN